VSSPSGALGDRPASGDGPAAVRTHPGLAGGPIYLDYNSTTPVDPRVSEAALPYLTTHFGNPANLHGYAAPAREALERARRQIGALIGARAHEIVLTASGSEANNLAIRGVVLAAGDARRHVVTQQTEHPAVLETCHALRRLHGVEVTYLPVDGTGRVDPHQLAGAITPRTALVSIMFANNETGTLQPIAELARLAREHGVLFHTDAAQAIGKLPVDVTALDVDLLTIAGHKLYAPKGIGALYVRPGVRLEPAIYGGGQERGLRAGTENVAFAVALGAAAELAAADLARGEPDRMRALRDELYGRLADGVPGGVRLNGHPTDRLPNTLNVSLGGARGDERLAAASGIAAATGSACHADVPDPSPVLTAMGIAPERALSAIRLSLGRWSTPADIEQAAALLGAARPDGSGR
jgi:cysteine desulfurase